MVYKKFRISLIIRILLLSLTIFLFIYLITTKGYYVTTILFAVIIILQIYLLINFVDKTNRDLASFLESIRYADFTRTFQIEGMGGSYEQLRDTFNNVMSDFQKIRSQKEEHYYYLHNIIEHVGISIIAYQRNGSVEMINNAAKQLFQLRKQRNVSELKNWSLELSNCLLSIRGEDHHLIKVQEGDEILQLSVHGTEFILNERSVILVTIKDIQAELEEQEMEAWQKLIRVLTHEIMNSITPISSLSFTINQMLHEVAASVEEHIPDGTEKETMRDIESAIATIQKRSSGLLHFVETYRNLTRIPKPSFTIFPVERLWINIKSLFDNELKKSNIIFTSIIEPNDMSLTADEQLIEQVIINLVKNAINALEGNAAGRIEFRSFFNKRNKVVIQISDNGHGILQEVRDKIFIPFFTTKPNGSGIGLSLSKQIMRLHNGSIAVHSEPNIQTIFTLSF